jgi:hypothetical protein
MNLQKISEAVLRWLEGFNGAGGTLLFLALAVWLRLVLLLVDEVVPSG